MKLIGTVFHHQRKLFFHDKGMMAFYIGGIVVLGFIMPLFVHSEGPQFTLAIIMTVTLQKQWLAESIAGERENRTLESLLSTSLPSGALLLGKMLFNLFTTVIYFVLMLACNLLSWYVVKADRTILPPAGWVLFLAASLGIFSIIALYGVSASGRAASVRDAGRGLTVVGYGCAIILAAVTVIITDQTGLSRYQIVTVLLLFMAVIAAVILFLLLRILKMHRPELMSAAGRAKARRKHSAKSIGTGVRSQIRSVFEHEWRYFCTLKGLIAQFVGFTLCPPLILWLGYDYLGQNNLYYAIIITIFLIPRIPTNLIAYSVGGEKAYKTGESILSTPVSVKALFLGKSVVPILISVIMLMISSVCNLVMGNWITKTGGGIPQLFYTADQVILLYAVGIAVSCLMIMVTGTFSLAAKNPRKGLYLSTFLGFLFILPLMGIIYLMPNKLIGAIIYFTALVALNVVLFAKLIGTERYYLMSRL